MFCEGKQYNAAVVFSRRTQHALQQRPGAIKLRHFRRYPETRPWREKPNYRRISFQPVAPLSRQLLLWPPTEKILTALVSASRRLVGAPKRGRGPEAE